MLAKILTHVPNLEGYCFAIALVAFIVWVGLL